MLLIYASSLTNKTPVPPVYYTQYYQVAEVGKKVEPESKSEPEREAPK